jgi:hypothetical protein
MECHTRIRPSDSYTRKNAPQNAMHDILDHIRVRTRPMLYLQTATLFSITYASPCQNASNKNRHMHTYNLHIHSHAPCAHLILPTVSALQRLQDTSPIHKATTQVPTSTINSRPQEQLLSLTPNKREIRDFASTCRQRLLTAGNRCPVFTLGSSPLKSVDRPAVVTQHLSDIPHIRNAKIFDDQARNHANAYFPRPSI